MVDKKYIILKNTLDAIQKQEEKKTRWQQTFNEMFDGTTSVPTYDQDLVNALVENLKLLFEVEDDDIFEWWLWENDFGRKCFHKDCYWINKRAIRLDSVEDFYSLLIGCPVDKVKEDREAFKRKYGKGYEKPKKPKCHRHHYNNDEYTDKQLQDTVDFLASQIQDLCSEPCTGVGVVYSTEGDKDVKNH